jgi:Flp pilus assembly protein TadB
MLLPFGPLLHAADKISACEILRGVTEIFPRHAEVLGGAATVVAAMVMVTVMTVMTVMTVVVMVVMVIEQIVQETSDKRSRKSWQQTEHSILHCR